MGPWTGTRARKSRPQTGRRPLRLAGEDGRARHLACLALVLRTDIDEPGSQKLPEGLPPGSFPDVGNFIAFVGNTESQSLIDHAKNAYDGAGVDVPSLAAALPESINGVGWSDHWSFWREGYPAFMVTDTAPFRYPHYHEPTDTPDQIDFPRYTDVVKGLRAVVDSLANDR